MSKIQQDGEKHFCQFSIQNECILNSCRVCGIRENKDDPKNVFVRSLRFNGYTVDQKYVLEMMLQKQNQNRDFKEDCSHEDFRESLVEYISGLALKMNYNQKTLHLAVSIMDQVFYHCPTIEKDQVTLIAVVSLMLAAKSEEQDFKIPTIQDIVSKFKGKFTVEQYLSCERVIFSQVLQFSVNIITPYSFVQEFLFRGILTTQEVGADQIPDELSQKMIVFYEELVYELLQFQLQHYEFYRFSSVVVAAAALACAKKMYGSEFIWDSHLSNMTGLNWQQVENCANLMIKLFYVDFNNRFKEIGRKRKRIQNEVKQCQIWYQSPINNKSINNQVDQMAPDFENEFFISQLSEQNSQNSFKFQSNEQSFTQDQSLQKSYSVNNLQYLLDYQQNLIKEDSQHGAKNSFNSMLHKTYSYQNNL